jgi:hypothetical protein
MDYLTWILLAYLVTSLLIMGLIYREGHTPEKYSYGNSKRSGCCGIPDAVATPERTEMYDLPTVHSSSYQSVLERKPFCKWCPDVGLAFAFLLMLVILPLLFLAGLIKESFFPTPESPQIGKPLHRLFGGDSGIKIEPVVNYPPQAEDVARAVEGLYKIPVMRK